MWASRFLRLSVIYALLAMALGFWMAVAVNPAQTPSHAHLAVLGFAGMALFGLFYRAWPEAEASALAPWHFWLANVGLVGSVAGSLAVYGGYYEVEPAVPLFFVLLIAGMLAFAVVVFRVTARAR